MRFRTTPVSFSSQPEPKPSLRFELLASEARINLQTSSRISPVYQTFCIHLLPHLPPPPIIPLSTIHNSANGHSTNRSTEPVGTVCLGRSLQEPNRRRGALWLSLPPAETCPDKDMRSTHSGTLQHERNPRSVWFTDGRAQSILVQRYLAGCKQRSSLLSLNITRPLLGLFPITPSALTVVQSRMSPNELCQRKVLCQN